jgi:hypothetical protein
VRVVLETDPQIAKRCLAAWTALCGFADPAVVNVCVAIVRHIGFVAPSLLPRPVLLGLCVLYPPPPTSSPNAPLTAALIRQIIAPSLPTTRVLAVLSVHS